MAVIKAPEYLEHYLPPLIFLGGPILGADDWQDAAIRYIQERAPELDIASPRRNGGWHNYFHESQVSWESFHLKKAGLESGCILFWLPKEKYHSCERPYAQTSRVEYGKWLAYHELAGANVAMGIEPGFSGEHYLHTILKTDCPRIPLSSTLEEACDDAIWLARLRIV